MADTASNVDALIDDLIASHDPRSTDLITLRGAVRPRPGVGALSRGLRRSRPRAADAAAHRDPPARGRCLAAAGPHLLQPVSRGAHDGHARQRRAAQACAPPDVHRRRRVVPALLGARLRFRPRRPLDPLRARRRRVDRERAEGVEHARAPREQGHARRAHRPRAAQAQGPHLLHGRHARAGRRGAPAAADHRRGRVQRGVPHRRADPRRRSHRRHRRRLARLDDHADERAHHDRRRHRRSRSAAAARSPRRSTRGTTPPTTPPRGAINS